MTDKLQTVNIIMQSGCKVSISMPPSNVQLMMEMHKDKSDGVICGPNFTVKMGNVDILEVLQ